MKEYKGKVVVVTGGGSGIGLALCARFVKEGARVILSDLNEKAANEKAGEIGATAIAANVAREEDVKNLVEKTIELYGQIDLFVSNAGIAFNGDENTPHQKWQLIFDVNVMAHIYAAKYVLPYMKEKGSGYLLNVASAAGLLMEFHSAPYTVSKHAAVGFAEWLAVTYAKDGIKVSVLCPAWVKTPMAEHVPGLIQQAIEPDELVEFTLKALAREEFMISTHDYILKIFQVKAADYQKYIVMQENRLKAEITADHQ